MFRRPIKEVSAEFIAEEKYLDSIQQVVRECCVAADLARKDRSAVMLAIEEAATNIIRHAYLYEKGTIRLRVVIYKKLIAFSLIDSGRSFHPERDGKINLERLVDSGRKGGLGFYMIQKIMDSVEYISSAGFNELRMIKKRRSSSGASAIVHSLFSLRVKFSLFTFLIVAFIICGTYWYVDDQTTTEVYRHLDSTASALSTTVADQAAGLILNSRSGVEFDELVVSYARSNPMINPLVLTDANGIILAHSEDPQLIQSQYLPQEFLEPTEIGVVQRQWVGAIQWNHIVVPIKNGSRTVGMVHLTYSAESVLKRLEEARLRILLFTLLLILFGIFGIYLLSNYFVKPIVKITNRVRRFTTGDLETELPLEGAEEFFEISRAFNEMITRLSRDRSNLIERERMAKEIEVASQIQKTLLPKEIMNIPGLELDAFYRAASMVGGDLYDIFEIENNRFCLVVADVSGKGVPASLVMSMLRTVIQIYARQSTSPKDIIVKVNEYLIESSPPGIFVTVFLAVYDAPDCKLSFVSAGHNPMLLFSPGKKSFTSFNPAGMPLGLPDTLSTSFADRLEEMELYLASEDVIVIYTDGVTEATDRDGTQFGEQQLSDFLLAQLEVESGRSIKDVSDNLVAKIDDFSGFTGQDDDITFVIARATGCDKERDCPKNEQN